MASGDREHSVVFSKRPLGFEVACQDAESRLGSLVASVDDGNAQAFLVTPGAVVVTINGVNLFRRPFQQCKDLLEQRKLPLEVTFCDPAPVASLTRKASVTDMETPDDGCCSSGNFPATISLVANIALFLAKLVVFLSTFSMSILASLVDSFLDLIVQIILFCTNKKARQADEKFPVGKTRLEPVGILTVAIIMIMLSIIVIRESIAILVPGAPEHQCFAPDGASLPRPTDPLGWNERNCTAPNTFRYGVRFSAVDGAVVGGVILIKFLLWLYCRTKDSPLVKALAEDHFNDVLANTVALGFVLVAWKVVDGDKQVAWFLDAAGAICVSLYILVIWGMMARDEVFKLVGEEAADETVQLLLEEAQGHCDQMEIDKLRAYHIGRNLMVEVEGVMPKETTLEIVHDVCIDLQYKIEAHDFVERAHVHVDYQSRDYDEHKRPTLI